MVFMDNNVVNLEDVQGFLIRGYNFRHSRYLIFNIKDAAGARAFCAALLPGKGGALSVTDGTVWPSGYKPEYCLNVGFTYYGLELLISKANCQTVGTASNELFPLFRRGAANLNNCMQIGDVDTSAPQNWWRNGGWMLPSAPVNDGSDLHIQVTLFAQTPEKREEYHDKLIAMIPEASGEPSLILAFIKDSDPVAEDPDIIHFGYKDSLSQPRLDNLPIEVRTDNGIDPDDRPKVLANRFIINCNQIDVKYKAHGLLKNGTFAAFRLLYQDVKKFNDFIGSDPDVPADLAAAKMCGRWFDGTPLVVSPNGENKELSGFDYTNFNYLNATTHQKGRRLNDELGEFCPYAAHIRRAHPRDDIKVKGNDVDNESHQIHRVLRRASPYGPPYVEGELKGVQRGLVGLFIGAKLTDQFQFIMQQWIESGGFRPGADLSPNASGVDPLFGAQANDLNADDHEFDYCDKDGSYKRMTGLTRFIRTDGSMYLFLPGIQGLEWISKGLIPAT